MRTDTSVPIPLLGESALRHPDPSVRWRCIQLLDHVGDGTEVSVLIEALDDPIPRVRRHAIHALACVGCRETLFCADDVVPPLIRLALEDANENVRLHAIDALLSSADARAEAALTALGLSDPSPLIRRAAQRPMGRRFAPRVWKRRMRQNAQANQAT
jgi:HEAT repeat protein